MKRALYLGFLVIFLATGWSSCKKDQADVPLTVGGLTAYPGNNRAMVEFDPPGNAKSGKVYYGNGQFVEFIVADATVPLQVVVEGLPETEQILRVVTFNADGGVSDPIGVKVKVYGAVYESHLKPRKWVNQINNSATSLQFVFDDAAENEQGVWVVYTNTTGAKDSVMMSNTENMVQVEDVDTGEPYYYYSIYKPEAGAIDLFHSPSLDLKTALKLDFKKSEWLIAGSSDAETNRNAELLIDNDISTSWQSQDGAAFPHWITVDMGNPKVIEGFYYVNFQGNGKSVKNMRFETSDDNVSWTLALEAEVKDNYLRQKLPITQPVTARYFRVTILDSWGDTATQTQFAEIDAYNIQNISGENGRDDNAGSTSIALVNAQHPFQGDGSDLFPAVGANRMQKLKGWTHNVSAYVTYDNSNQNFSLFTAPVWGLGSVTNGKVSQAVNLQPGQYLLKIVLGGADGPVDIYGMVTEAGALPDYTAVKSSGSVLKYHDISDAKKETVEMAFTITAAADVNIGLVYNTYNQYSETGKPWTSYNITRFEMLKVK